MQDTAPRHVDVVIVGAGLAGLAAADRLRHSGLSVTVLEADDRIGGRTFGAYWAPAGRDIDLGGTWLLPGFTQTQALLGEFGIPTRDSPPVAEPLTHLSGGVSVRATASAAEAETLDTIAGELRTLIAQSPRALSAEEALDELSVSGFALDWHRATQRYLAGAAMSQIDASHLLIAPQDLRDPDHYATQITGTTRALVDALANRSAADLRLGCVVDRVEQHGAGYRVRTRAGAAWAAAAVILAVPRNVLAGITVPATIQAGTAALAAVPHAGAARKDWFVLDGVTDHFRVFASEGPFGYFRSEARLPDGGILAVALTPSAEGAPRVLDMEAGMRQYLPGVVVRAHLSHDWVASPWAGGTWWVPVPGDPALHPDAQADLASADGRLHLVGGDVCPDFPGTLEGALRTGIAAAENVERLFAAHARGTAHAQITESPTH